MRADQPEDHKYFSREKMDKDYMKKMLMHKSPT
jgi:hypothetical protein